MLNDSPVVRAAGPRLLFLSGAVVTAALYLWMHWMRGNGELHGMSVIFFALFAWNDYGATICELLILGAAVFLASRLPAGRILAAAGARPRLLAAIYTLILGAGAVFIYHAHPLSVDEYAAYFQSQVFAAGHLTGRFPLPQLEWLIPPGFRNFFLTISPTTGEVASAYWPGHALLMTPFTALGIAWACNPLLSGLTLLAIHRLAMEIFADAEAAGLALLLTMASPVVFGLGISYYAMPAHLLANCLYALLLLRPTPARALLAGLVGSIALCLHNPVPHLLFALPWLIWIATRAGGLRLFAALCAGYLPLSLLLGVGFFEFTNHLRNPLPGPTSGSDAAGYLQLMLKVVSIPTPASLLNHLIAVAKVWIWAVPGLVSLAIYGAVRWRRNSACLLFAASALVTLVAYLFFLPDQGHGWGYRYFHSAWMALPLLATAAIYRPANTGPAAAGIFEGAQTRSYLTACIVLTLVFGLGYRAWQMQAFMARDIAQLPHYRGTEPRVEIIDYEFSFYGADLVQNDPWLRGNEIRMLAHDPRADRQMMQRNYPDLHLVYFDRYGAVWSKAPVQLQTHPVH